MNKLFQGKIIQKKSKLKYEEQAILINNNLISIKDKLSCKAIVLIVLLFLVIILSLIFAFIIHIKGRKYHFRIPNKFKYLKNNSKREFKKSLLTNISISHNQTVFSNIIYNNETKAKMKIKEKNIKISSRNITKIKNYLDKIKITKYAFRYRHRAIPKKKLLWKGKKYIDKIKIKSVIRHYNDLNISFNNKEDFYKRKKPKVSIVITVYNQEKFINTSYAFIQNQTLKDIEIIYVDDNSKDNSSSIIKQLMVHDKRIIYLKNDKNKRALLSRFKGILNSTGEYILVIDPDDLLLNDILIKAYETAKNYNLDILQYYVLSGSYYDNRLWKEAKYRDGILYNSSVMDVFYYCVTRNLWDKLVKREVYIKSINFMREEFRNEIYTIHNDDTAFFGLIKVAKSYGFLEEIGYFYNLNNPNSTRQFYYDNNYINTAIHSLMATMKYYFIQSDNNAFEKYYVAYKFFIDKVNDYKFKLGHLTEGFDYINNVLDLYLNCTFFSYIQKSYIMDFKNEVCRIQKMRASL